MRRSVFAVLQALERYKTNAIAESESITDEYDDLVNSLSLDDTFVFHASLDVLPSHSWKAPYADIQVRTDN
jgi:hypothetical protein